MCQTKEITTACVSAPPKIFHRSATLQQAVDPLMQSPAEMSDEAGAGNMSVSRSGNALTRLLAYKFKVNPSLIPEKCDLRDFLNYKRITIDKIRGADLK